jgi:hypothetical protein
MHFAFLFKGRVKGYALVSVGTQISTIPCCPTLKLEWLGHLIDAQTSNLLLMTWQVASRLPGRLT